MKVGDLVQLSSYGVSRSFNSQLTIDHPEQTGLIIKVDEAGYYRAYPYVIQWSKTPTDRHGREWIHHRRELKYAGR